MPLSPTGLDALRNMQSNYGGKKGKSIFYASINTGKPGSEKWEGRGLDKLRL